MEQEYELSFTAEQIDERLGKVDKAILSTPQSLTPGEQAQARDNIEVDSIVCSASGAFIDINDASNQPLKALTIYGKTTQNGTPTPETPAELVSVGDSGSITIGVTGKNIFGGEALADKLVSLGATKNEEERTVSFTGAIIAGKVIFDNFKPNTQYRFIIYGTCNAASTSTNLTIKYADVSVNNDTPKFKNTGSKEGAIPSLTDVQISKSTNIESLMGRNGTGDETTVTLYYDKCGIFEYDGNPTVWTEEVNEFEEFKGQIFAIKTPNNLRGIPTYTTAQLALDSATYIDNSGTHWICDEVNSNRKMRITRIGIVDMGRLSWTYSTSKKIFYTAIPGHLYTVGFYVLCDAYKATYTQNEFENTDKSIASYYAVTTGKRINVRDSDCTDVETFNAAVTGKNIMYVLKNPIETPLTEEELAQYAEIHTVKSTTNIFNDGGAFMELTYEADTKTYIDNKFNELATAIVNNT